MLYLTNWNDHKIHIIAYDFTIHWNHFETIYNWNPKPKLESKLYTSYSDRQSSIDGKPKHSNSAHCNTWCNWCQLDLTPNVSTGQGLSSYILNEPHRSSLIICELTVMRVVGSSLEYTVDCSVMTCWVRGFSFTMETALATRLSMVERGGVWGVCVGGGGGGC